MLRTDVWQVEHIWTVTSGVAAGDAELDVWTGMVSTEKRNRILFPRKSTGMVIWGAYCCDGHQVVSGWQPKVADVAREAGRGRVADGPCHHLVCLRRGRRHCMGPSARRTVIKISRHLPVDPSGHTSVMSTMLMTSTPTHLPHSPVGRALPGYDSMMVSVNGTVSEPGKLEPPDGVSAPEVTETVLVKNVLVVIALVEPVTVGNVGRELLPAGVKDPTPPDVRLGNEAVSALLPPELTGLTDDRAEEPRPPEGGREPDGEPAEAGGSELLGGGAPYVGIVTGDCEADTGGGRLLVPVADDEPEDPAGGGSDEPATLLGLPPGGDTGLETDGTVPDVSGMEADKLAEFDALEP